mmetsp:Transcript_36214/g.78128  ORF Transcript_36214/g.78128 Transcript_36214/m.78128 type:complete len:85 (+) Transcript_36214:138-392(+)
MGGSFSAPQVSHNSSETCAQTSQMHHTLCSQLTTRLNNNTQSQTRYIFAIVKFPPILSSISSPQPWISSSTSHHAIVVLKKREE